MWGYDFAEQFEEINDLIRDFIRDVIFSNEDPFSEDHYSEFDLKFDFYQENQMYSQICRKCVEKNAESRSEPM